MRSQGCPLEGQVAIVTGASSGIGRATAVTLARAGASVVVNFIGAREPADEVVSMIEADWGHAIAVEADVADEEQVKALFSQTTEQFGSVHILVNNAGIERNSAFTEMSKEDWDAVIDVNLTGQFLCAREAIKEFLRQGVDENTSRAAGKIVFMGSVHQRIPWAKHANYAASKGGTTLLVESLAQEFADRRIRVNAVAPGAIRTSINRDAWESQQALDALLTMIPYGRIGETDDVSNAIAWLCSDESDYVTGTTLTIDGGMSLYPAFSEGGG